MGSFKMERRCSFVWAGSSFVETGETLVDKEVPASLRDSFFFSWATSSWSLHPTSRKSALAIMSMYFIFSPLSVYGLAL